MRIVQTSWTYSTKWKKTERRFDKKNKKEFFDIVRQTIYADDFYGQNYKTLSRVIGKNENYTPLT